MTVVVVVMVIVVVSVVMTVCMIMATTFFSAQMIMSISRVQNFHLNKIEDEAHYSDNKHDVSFNSRRFKETLSGLDEKPAGHDPDR